MGFFGESKKAKRERKLFELAEQLKMPKEDREYFNFNLDLFEARIKNRENIVSKFGIEHVLYLDKIEWLFSVLKNVENELSIRRTTLQVIDKPRADLLDAIYKVIEKNVERSFAGIIRERKTIDTYEDEECFDNLENLKRLFFQSIKHPEGEEQESEFKLLQSNFDSVVGENFRKKLSKKLEDYFKSQASKYSGMYGFWPRPEEVRALVDSLLGASDSKSLGEEIAEDIGGEGDNNKHIFCIQIQSNIDGKQYVQIGVSNDSPENYKNDVTSIVSVHYDAVLDSDVASALQKGIIKNYTPFDYKVNEHFTEFERFDGYEEIIPMKHMSEACQDIRKVAENLDDIEFIADNLSALYQSTEG